MTWSFNEWWNKPIQTRDYVAAVLIGASVGAVLGMILLFIVTFGMMTGQNLGFAAIAGATAGAFIGLVFPKVTITLLILLASAGFTSPFS